jgi:hypothetical protein
MITHSAAETSPPFRMVSSPVGHQSGEHGDEHAHRGLPALVGRRDQVEHVGDRQEVSQRGGRGPGQHGHDDRAGQQHAEHEGRPAAAHADRYHRDQDEEDGQRPGQRERPVGYGAVRALDGHDDAAPDRREQDQAEHPADHVVKRRPVPGTEPLGQRRPLTGGRNL